MEFLKELFIFLVAALAVVPLLNRLGLSSVIGYLVAGILIGPSVFGLIDNADSVLHFAELGVVLLLFIIGLELQPRRLWVMRQAVFGLGTAQVAVVTAGLTVLLMVTAGMDISPAAVLGFSLALSSTAFVLQLLGEKKQLNYAHGRAAFGVLLFQDIAVIPALVVLSMLGGDDDHGSVSMVAIGAVMALVVAARFLIRPILRIIAATGVHELFIAAGLTIVCGAAIAMYQAGLSMGLGAFIAGMLVADSEYRYQLETDVMPFKGLLLGLFFIAVGMSADLSLLTSEPVLIIGLTLALVPVKLLLFLPVTLLYGLNRDDALRTTLILSQGGEFAFVLLTAAVSASVIPVEYMEISILVVTLSMATTPFLMMALESMLGRGEGNRDFDDMDEDESPVIIAGFGRFGQIVGRVLTMQHQPFTALDANPGQIDIVREFGNEVFYGDATRLDTLQNAGVANARALVITIADIEDSVHITEILRERYPQLPILARARNRQHEIKLRELGVHFVIRETLLSSLELSRELLTVLSLDPTDVDVFKAHDEEALQKQAAVIHDDKAYRQTTMDVAEELKQLFSEDRTN